MKNIFKFLKRHWQGYGMIDLINEILEDKWKELEKEENLQKSADESIQRLSEIIVNLDAINDFEREYDYYVEQIEKKEEEPTDEQIEGLMFGLYEKWTFIFCAMLNLDINNPFVLTYMHGAIVTLVEDEE